MRIVLMLLGAAICGGALLFWIYLNGLAASWNTSGNKQPIDWFTKDALVFFWLPFAVGAAVAAVAYFGWRRQS